MQHHVERKAWTEIIFNVLHGSIFGLTSFPWGCFWSERSTYNAAVWVPARDFTCLVEAWSSAVGSSRGAAAPPVSLARGHACLRAEVLVYIWCWLNPWERSAPPRSVVKVFLLLHQQSLMLRTRCLRTLSVSASVDDMKKVGLSPSLDSTAEPGCTRLYSILDIISRRAY